MGILYTEICKEDYDKTLRLWLQTYSKNIVEYKTFGSPLVSFFSITHKNLLSGAVIKKVKDKMGKKSLYFRSDGGALDDREMLEKKMKI
jgi:hypothetical protein